MKNVQRIAIDEIAVSKGHKYLTVVLDMETGRVIFVFRISSGPLEGTNNKIKTMKRMAYGFRDRDFFKLKIMALHETKYVLVG